MTAPPLLSDRAFQRAHGSYLSGVEAGLPPAGKRPGTCRVCACPVGDGFFLCPPCGGVRRATAAGRAPFPLDWLAFLTYAVEWWDVTGTAAPAGWDETSERRGRQAYSVLKGYKADSPPRRLYTDAAAWTAWFLQRWGPDADWPARRVDREWLWAAVPSVRSGRKGEHPFRVLASKVLNAGREVRLRVAEGAGGRGFDPGLFECDSLPGGAAVLVVDDSWTSGGNVLSAAAALRRAGAASVNAMVLGRLLNPAAWEPSRRFIDAGGLRRGFDPARSPWAKVG